MTLRKSIFIDFTLLTTAITVFTFTCGSAYIGGFMRSFGFKEGALGLTFQDYLMFGGLNGYKGLFYIFSALIALSFINSLTDKKIHISLLKPIFYLFSFPFLFFFNWFKSYGSLPISLHLQLFYLKENSQHKYKNIETEAKPISSLIKSMVYKTHCTLFEIVEWEDTNDNQNIDKGAKEFLRYYLYLILMYILILSFLYFLVDTEKNGIQAAKHALKGLDQEIVIKDELIQDYLKLNYKEVSQPLKGKILECGSTHCLIAINTIGLTRINSKTPMQNAYLIKPIQANSYMVFKKDENNFPTILD